MKPYYDHAGIQIFHCDCREILPTLKPVDLVLKNGLTNSTDNATIGYDKLGKTESGNGVAVSRSALVDGTDRELLQNVTNGNIEGDEATGDSVAREGAQGCREWEIQGRDTEQALSPDDSERQVFGLRGSGAASCSPQERKPHRQPSRKPSNTLRELSQQASQKTMVGKAKIVCQIAAKRLAQEVLPL